MSIVNSSIKAKIREGLKDLGECKNGLATAYSPKRTVYITYAYSFPERYFMILGEEEAENLSADIVCGAVKHIDERMDAYNAAPEDKDIIFRALQIDVVDGLRHFYVRAGTEHKLSPEVYDGSNHKVCDVI